FWADRLRREVQESKAEPLPPHVRRLFASCRVDLRPAGGLGVPADSKADALPRRAREILSSYGATGRRETPAQWAERAAKADSEERGAARAVIAAGRPLALDLEGAGHDSRPVLVVVQAADGGGGVAVLAGAWRVARVEIERIG